MAENQEAEKTEGNDLRSKIMAIMRDTTLSDAEKARKRQELMTGKWTEAEPSSAGEESAQRGVLGPRLGVSLR